MVLTKYAKRLAPVGLAFALVVAFTSPAQAATLSSISLLQSTSVPSATANYTFTVSNVTDATDLRCVVIEFGTGADGSGAPTGFDASAATISGNLVDFTGWASGGDADTVQFSDAGNEDVSSPSARTIILTGVTNSSVADTTFYALIRTYSNAGCSTLVDSGVAAFIHTANTVVSVIVDPSLSFTVADATNCNGVSDTAGTTASGTAVDLGRVNTGTRPFKAQGLTVSTNASGGFTVYAKYDGLLRAGGNNIDDWTGTNASPTATWSAGTEAFGYTLDDATLSGTANRFTNGGAKFAALTSTNAEVSYQSAGPVSSNTQCIGYQVGVAGATLAGAYQTTVTYTAMPVF